MGSTYCFEDVETAQPVELYLESGQEPPRIGDVAIFNGRWLRRLVTLPQVKNPREFGHVSYSRPRWDPDAPRYTTDGKPVFLNEREVRTYESKREDRTLGTEKARYDP